MEVDGRREEEEEEANLLQSHIISWNRIMSRFRNGYFFLSFEIVSFFSFFFQVNDQK